MRPEDYEKRVISRALEAMADEEGRLRGQAEVRRASADRVATDAEAEGGEDKADALREVQVSLGVAGALEREAVAIRRRAGALATGVPAGNVSPKKPPPEKAPDVEDVVFTLTTSAGDSALAADTYFLAALELLKGPPSRESWTDASARLRGLAWPQGLPAARASAALKVLDALVAKLP